MRNSNIRVIENLTSVIRLRQVGVKIISGWLIADAWQSL